MLVRFDIFFDGAGRGEEVGEGEQLDHPCCRHPDCIELSRIMAKQVWLSSMTASSYRGRVAKQDGICFVQMTASFCHFVETKDAVLSSQTTSAAWALVCDRNCLLLNENDRRFQHMILLLSLQMDPWHLITNFSSRKHVSWTPNPHLFRWNMQALCWNNY